MTEEALNTEVVADAVIADTSSAETVVSPDAAMDEVWNRLQRDNGAARENGRFVSADPDKREAQTAETPLEGGEGGEQTVPSQADVPLPANWIGKDELWAKLPADVKAEIAEHQKDQHAKLSEYGRAKATYEPLQKAAQEFAEYFNGTLKAADGQPISPADGIRYLANIQRQMDRDPVNTLLSITDTYGARDKVAAQLGVKPAEGQQPDPSARENALLAKIDRLEGLLQQAADPSRIAKVVDEKIDLTRHQEEVSRMEKSMPLRSRIDDETMVFFINKAWKSLGDDATKEAVYTHAYNAAVEADPALRALAKAAQSAAEDKTTKAEGAKRAASVNLKSTSAGKARVLSDDEAMEAKWAELH